LLLDYDQYPGYSGQAGAINSIIQEVVIMEKFLAPFTPYAYALLRIVTGLLFLCHGGQKVFGWFGGVGGSAVLLTSQLGVAGLLEIILGLLVAIGLWSSYAAFIASGEMAVAYFIAHFPRSFWPLENEGEPAVLFCFTFLYMATKGPGIWSVDAASGRRRRRMFR
jgi:putative oxidoreductase